jgi:hypothetical protein
MTDTRRKTVKPVPVDPRLQEVYEDKSGRRWYEFTHDGLMCYKRFMSAQIAERFLRLGFTEEFLNRVIDLGIKIAYDTTKTETQVRQDQAAIWQNLQMRKGYISGEDQYLRLAAVYFVLADEPLTECYETWTQKKIQMWNEDQDAKDFFLQRALAKVHSLPNISIQDMQLLLTIAREREANIPTLPQG